MATKRSPSFALSILDGICYTSNHTYAMSLSHFHCYCRCHCNFIQLNRLFSLYFWPNVIVSMIVTFEPIPWAYSIVLWIQISDDHELKLLRFYMIYKELYKTKFLDWFAGLSTKIFRHAFQNILFQCLWWTLKKNSSFFVHLLFNSKRSDSCSRAPLILLYIRLCDSLPSMWCHRHRKKHVKYYFPILSFDFSSFIIIHGIYAFPFNRHLQCIHCICYCFCCSCYLNILV